MTSTAATVRKVARPKGMQIRFTQSADSYFILPPGYAISAIYIENTTANAITGGIDIGSTDAGTDVASGYAVGASAKIHVAEASLLLRYFSRTVAQNIYIIAHTSWNSASLNVTVVCDKVSP